MNDFVAFEAYPQIQERDAGAKPEEKERANEAKRANEARDERREREREDLSKLAENLQAKGEVVVDDMAVESKDEGSFTWVINKFKEIKDEELYSEDFTIGGYKWRLKIFPKGKSKGKGTHVSLYLHVVDSDTLPYCWSRSASFTLSVFRIMTTSKAAEWTTNTSFMPSRRTGGGTSSCLSMSCRGDFVSDGYEGEARSGRSGSRRGSRFGETNTFLTP